jgi:hypothetical protein
MLDLNPHRSKCRYLKSSHPPVLILALSQVFAACFHGGRSGEIKLIFYRDHTVLLKFSTYRDNILLSMLQTSRLYLYFGNVTVLSTNCQKKESCGTRPMRGY